MRDDMSLVSGSRSARASSTASALKRSGRTRASTHMESSRPSSYAASDRTRFTVNASEISVPELVNDTSTTGAFSSDNMSMSNRSTNMLEVLETLPLDPGAEEEDVEDDDLDDADSGYVPTTYQTRYGQYGAETVYSETTGHTLNSTTRSLNPLDLPYMYENGRRYCSDYFMPNDEAEQTRLHLCHQVYKRTLDGDLTTVRLEDPTHILDVGAATGEWAMEMAETYPDCDVVGMDISDVFERSAPVNCNWEVDDAELEWERPSNHYDLIHLRNMEGSFRDWESVYDSAYRCLKPGGWIEITDFDDLRGFRNFLDYFAPDSIVQKVADDVEAAALKSGKPHGVHHLEPKLLINAGYTDVNVTDYTIPLRTKDGSAGKLWLVATLDCIESTSLRLLTRYMGWTPDEVRLACNQIADEMVDIARSAKRGKGWHMKLKVLTGRKPAGGHSVWSSGSSIAGSNRTQMTAGNDTLGSGGTGESTDDLSANGARDEVDSKSPPPGPVSQRASYSETTSCAYSYATAGSTDVDNSESTVN